MIGKLLILLSPIILIISYIYYDVNKRQKIEEQQFEILKEIGMENKICNIIKSDYKFEDMHQLNDELIILSTINDEVLYEHKYLNEYIKKGKIFAFNIKSKEFFEIPLNNFPNDLIFSPIGIDILNKEYLFVINHSGTPKDSNERIEIFKINLSGEKKIELIYEKSIMLPKKYFGTLNGIAVIDLNSFFFITSNYFSLPLKNSFYEKILYKIKKFIEKVLNTYKIKANYVYLYEYGKISKIKESNAILNNGIAYDSKFKFLFSARTIEKDIQLYKIEELINESYRFNSIKLPYNINKIVFKDKKLYCGITSNIHYIKTIKKEIKEKGNANHISHFSGFIEISLHKDNNITDILLQDKFKAVNSAIKVGNKTILSSVAENGLFICEEK